MLSIYIILQSYCKVLQTVSEVFSVELVSNHVACSLHIVQMSHAMTLDLAACTVCRGAMT